MLQEVGFSPPPAIQTGLVVERVRTIREEIARLEGARRPQEERPLSTGCDALDRFLPARGFRRGTLVEWISSGDGDGVETLALLAARQACRDGGVMVVLDAAREFYSPAAARWGIPLEQLLLVQVSQASDYLWALDQSLRSPGVAVVLAWLGSSQHVGWGFPINTKTFRRLQLAAEAGGGLGLLIRPREALQEPSWADVRLAVEPLPSAGDRSIFRPQDVPVEKPSSRKHAPVSFPAPPVGRRLSIQVLSSRAGGSGGRLEVEIDESARTVHLASPLADPTLGRPATADPLSPEDRS